MDVVRESGFQDVAAPDEDASVDCEERRMADAVAASCVRSGADLSDDAVHVGFNAALVALTGMYKGYAASGLVDQGAYDLVVATVAALMNASDVIRRD